jgi:hypothetical protein
MTLKFLAPRQRVRLTGAAVLLIGLLVAFALYFSATGQEGNDAIGYRIVNGQVYAVTAAEEPRRIQELERIGGKGEVWIYRFDRWLVSLMHGKRLAWTLGLTSLAIALLCFHIASLMDGDAAEAASGPGRDGPAGTGSTPRHCRGARLHRGPHRATPAGSSAYRSRVSRLRGLPGSTIRKPRASSASAACHRPS